MKTDFLTKIAPPIANNDSASTTKGVPVTFDILANDSCVGSCDPASLVITAGKGSVVNAGGGKVTYTPALNYVGTDTFSYTVRDTVTGATASNTAKVSVVVGSGTTKAAPAAAPAAASTIQNSVVGVSTTGSDKTCIGCSVTVTSAPTHGTVVANAPNPGEMTYTPNPTFLGTETFSYAVTDATGASTPAAVAVAVGRNPVTDVVTLNTVAVGAAGKLSVAGSVSALNSAFAPSVQVFSGTANASHTGCTGTLLGTAVVGTKGGFGFGGKGGVAGANICVQSTNLGVAEAVAK
jgi:Big-like domain-containing protein